MADTNICRSMSVVELIKANKTNKLALDVIEAIPDTMPILIMAGEKDAVVKASALPKMMARLKSKDKSLQVLPNKGHLLIEHQKFDANISQIVGNWLDNRPNPIVVSKLSHQERQP